MSDHKRRIGVLVFVMVILFIIGTVQVSADLNIHGNPSKSGIHYSQATIPGIISLGKLVEEDLGSPEGVPVSILPIDVPDAPPEEQPAGPQPNPEPIQPPEDPGIPATGMEHQLQVEVPVNNIPPYFSMEMEPPKTYTPITEKPVVILPTTQKSTNQTSFKSKGSIITGKVPYKTLKISVPGVSVPGKNSRFSSYNTTKK